MKNEDKWQVNYEALNAYVIEHKHLPDKHKETDRNKLSQEVPDEKEEGWDTDRGAEPAAG